MQHHGHHHHDIHVHNPHHHYPHHHEPAVVVGKKYYFDIRMLRNSICFFNLVNLFFFPMQFMKLTIHHPRPIHRRRTLLQVFLHLHLQLFLLHLHQELIHLQRTCIPNTQDLCHHLIHLQLGRIFHRHQDLPILLHHLSQEQVLLIRSHLIHNLAAILPLDNLEVIIHLLLCD